MSKTALLFNLMSSHLSQFHFNKVIKGRIIGSRVAKKKKKKTYFPIFTYSFKKSDMF